MSQENLKSRDEKYVGRDSDPQDIVVDRLDRSFLYTTRGKRYIDFTSAWCVSNFGWNNPDIKSRLGQFDGPEYVSPHHIYRPWVDLSERLAKLSPGNLRKAFRATGGSEAVDIALQAAMNFTKRQKFISVEDAYHGDTITVRSIGRPDFGSWYTNHFGAHRIPAPLDGKSADQVEKWLSKKDIAAVIMEPIICNRGVMAPTQEFMDRVQAACKKNGSVFIVDEIATGFGRTGPVFASELYDLKPDIMCLGKALSGGYAPIGAVMMTDELAEAMHYQSSFYSTYGWHPLGVEAAHASLDYMENNWSELQANVREMGNYISDRIQGMKFKKPIKVSQVGLAIGVNTQTEEYAKEIVKKARENGLLISEGEKGFDIYPALNITRGEVDEALDLLEKSI